ncbi:MAG: cobalamin-dependent protein [Magnetospirillum sp. WYHS-4]
MRFLLVVPRFITGARQTYHFPFGIAYVSAVLKRAGHEVHCLNLNHQDGRPADVVGQAVRALDPQVLATGGISPHYGRVKDILSAGRAAKPGLRTVIGGGLLTSAPNQVARMLDLDIGVIGEGEETVVDLARALEHGEDLASVDGLVIRRPDGTFAKTRNRKPVKDLDSLPWPDYDGFQARLLVESPPDGSNYFQQAVESPRTLALISSRSCPFACTFCFHPNGRVYRERGLDDVFAELEFLVDRYGVNAVWVLDELFAVRHERLVDFCHRIAPMKLKWMVSLRVGEAGAETLDMMRDAGCVFIGYGLESADDRILASMKKKTTRARMEDALRLTYEKRMGIIGNFIFGDPDETIETASNTIDWWGRHPEYRISLVPLLAYPGTRVFEDALATGKIADFETAFTTPLYNLTAMPDEDYTRMIQKLRVFGETLLLPAEATACKRQEDDGSLYRIDWLCPRCGQENRHGDVDAIYPFHYQKVNLTCRSCLARFDLPNPIREPWRDPEAEALQAEATRWRQAGDIARATQGYEAVLARPYPPEKMDRPEAFIQAALDLGTLALGQNQPRKAVHWIGEALLRRAFDPTTHLAYAVALLAEGCHDAAALHLDQARRLAPRAQGALAERMAGLRRLVAEARRDAPGLAYFTPPTSPP